MTAVALGWVVGDWTTGGALLFWRLNRKLIGVMVGDGAILGLRKRFRIVEPWCVDCTLR
jgi:hypothetical protein